MTTYIHISDPRVAHFDMLIYPGPGQTVVVHIENERTPGLQPTCRTKTYTTQGASELQVVTGDCGCP